MRRVSSFGLVLIVLQFTSCDAPRTNPLDPLAESGATVSISGEVTSYYAPFLPMEGVQVTLSPSQISVATDVAGKFSFRSVGPGDYVVSVDAEGFRASPQALSISPGEKQDVSLRLDALPFVVSASVSSVHVSRWWPEQDIFLLEVDALLGDDDGLADIDSAWVTLDGTYAFRLNETPTAGRYAASVEDNALPIRVLDDLLGRSLEVNIVDMAGFQSSPSLSPLVRIIHDTPIALSPIDLQIVAGAPTYQWNPPVALFDHSIEVQVVRAETNIETTAETIRDIPSSVSSVEGIALPAGTYYWVVWLVDNFGNRSRSKQAGFRVL